MTVVDFGDRLTWHKATRSGDQGGNCLCVTRDPATGQIGVRDSKAGPAGPTQWYTPTAWTAFLTTITTGEIPPA